MPAFVGERVGGGLPGVTECGEQAVDHADIGEAEALRALRHGAELLLEVGLLRVRWHVVPSLLCVACRVMCRRMDARASRRTRG